MRRLLFQSLFRSPLTERAPSPDEAAVEELAAAVERAARQRLGRSLSIREIDAGSCNACELEIHALNNPYYDVERFGIRFVASLPGAVVVVSVIVGWLGGAVNGAAISTQEFTSAERCEAARLALVQDAKARGLEDALRPICLQTRRQAATESSTASRSQRPSPPSVVLERTR